MQNSLAAGIEVFQEDMSRDVEDKGLCDEIIFHILRISGNSA
jgi:hypothetical protein